MNLLIIHQAFTSPSEAGGTRHFEFAKNLVARGHRVSIIASQLSYLTGDRVGAASTPGDRPEEHDGVRVVRAYTHPSLHKSFTWRLFTFFSFMISATWAGWRIRSVDVVMGTSPPIFQAVSAWLIAFIRRKPFLLEIRDLWPEFAIDMGVLKNRTLIRLSRGLERWLYRRATHILVNSPAYVDYLETHGVPRDKVTLIPNGVDPDMFDPNADGSAVRKEFGLGGKFVVTYAGALGPANDIDNILRAAVTLADEPDVHFLLVGDGKDRPRLETSVADLGLQNVTLAGARPKSMMTGVLAASDACVATLMNIPMFKTTYPNKVFDYMAAGRPTILAIDGVIREVIERSNGGLFVPPGDSNALADAARNLNTRRDGARRMGESARQYVCEHFDRRQHAKQFEELILGLAGSRES